MEDRKERGSSGDGVRVGCVPPRACCLLSSDSAQEQQARLNSVLAHSSPLVSSISTFRLYSMPMG